MSQDECRESRSLTLEQLVHVAWGHAVPYRHRYNRQIGVAEMNCNFRFDCLQPCGRDTPLACLVGDVWLRADRERGEIDNVTGAGLGQLRHLERVASMQRPD